jgi:hypothetical protein
LIDPARTDQIAGLPVDDHGGRPADARRDDGDHRESGLDRDPGHALGRAREDHDVGGGQEGSHVADLA